MSGGIHVHSAVHLDLRKLNPAILLRCNHPDGRVSFEIGDGSTNVWINGTAEQFDLFADVIDALAARIRTEETS